VAEEKHWGLAQKPHHEHKTTPSAHGELVHWLESFRLLAVKHDIDIVAGTIVEKGEAEGEPVMRNVAHYITRKGEIVGRYEKRNLW
jgi:predicted amidohydrolase